MQLVECSQIKPLLQQAQTIAAARDVRGAIPVIMQCTNLGGMETVTYALMDHLARRGFNFSFCTPRPWGLGKSRVLRVDPNAQDFQYRGKFGWKTFLPYVRHLKPVVRKSKRVWVIGPCACSLSAVALSGGRALLSHHQYHFGDGTARLCWGAFYALFGSFLDAITYPSEFTRTEALSVAPWLESKAYVVRNGVHVSYRGEDERLEARRQARQELGFPQDAFLIGNAGWLVKQKRFDVFLHTASRIARKLEKARFVICGGGPEEGALKELARTLGIADKVRFTGWVTNMPTYYSAWDVVLFSSDFESMGGTPMEGASHGCVSVASCSYGGLSEFLQDGRTGIFFQRHDPEALAREVVNIAINPLWANSLRQAAVELLHQKFNLESALEFYEAYFRKTFL